MTGETKRSPLLVEEDWWTVWFGMAILLIATVLGMMTLSGTISAKKVPKIGKWTSNPADVLYQSKKTTIDLSEGSTLVEVADRINAAETSANAEVIPDAGGFQLRIASSRTGDGETISLSALLTGGMTQLQFTEVDPDPAGIGARAYTSQILNSPDIVVGSGKLIVTAERTKSIVLPLIVTMIFILAVTVIGVYGMGQNGLSYSVAFGAVFILAVLSFTIANQNTIHAYGLSYAAWALVLGLLISNTVGTPSWLKPAVRTEM